MSIHDDSKASASQDEDPASTASDAETTNDASGEDAEPVAETVEAQLEEARRQAADHFERFIRAKADLENVLKRHQRELADRSRYDGEALARDILQAVDDLERALEHSGEAAAEGVSGGVELVLKGMLAALKRNGVERIDAQGKPFDPAEHEAVTMVETDEVPPGTVVAVFRAGYKMRDRLLRAAMVSVAKAPEQKTGQKS